MRLFKKLGRQLRARGQNRTTTIGVELCEQRVLLATMQFLVTNELNAGLGSLRQAITDANADFAAHPTDSEIINFAISTAAPFKISLSTALPAIEGPTLLDGTSQSGYAGAPLIQIDGQTHSIPGDGLDLAAGSDNSRVRGLDIYGFSSGAAIDVQSNSDVIQNNYLGTDITGSTGIANEEGVLVNGVTGTTIGGVTSVGNLISGNSIGILIQSSSSGTSVGGNLIGTNAAGSVGVPNVTANTTAGIQITGSSGNSIGATTAGAGNVIAFNTNLTGSAIGVDVESGTDNPIVGNAIFGDDQAIVLNTSNNANNSQAPPSLTYATRISGSTLVEGVLQTGFLANTTYEVDLYSGSGSGQAQFFLASESVTTGPSGTASFSFTFEVGVPVGQVITATATDGSGNTSQLSNSPNFTDTTNATVVNAFVVTTNSALSGNLNGGLTSLSQAISNADADTTNTSADTISFAITGSTTITVSPSTLLPSISHAVILDGTTQTGYKGAPIIVIDGNGTTGDGLQLISGSDSSTIKGLDIVNFVGPGIEIASTDNTVQSNYLGINAAGTAAGPGNTVGVQIDSAASNTIGGTAAGAANTIAYNSTDGIVVNGATSSFNTIRQNSIYNNPANSQSAAGIALEGGANNGQQPVTISTATSSGGQTTIEGTDSGLVIGTILEVFASAIGDNPQPDQAHIFLGSKTLSSVIPATFSVTLPVTLSLTQFVTATATAPNGDTSEFATEVQVTNPFLVTNTNASGPGSLAQAILNVNADTVNSIADIITFQIPTTDPGYNSTTKTWTITVSSTQQISHAVFLDATTQPGYVGSPVIVVDGNGTVPDGLQLTTGSDDSTIKGLDIVDFAGPGIEIQTSDNTLQSNYLGVDATGTKAGPGNQVGVLIGGSNNTIGGTSSGAGNTIAFNTNAGAGAGVEVETAQTGDSIRGNLIFSNDQQIVLDGTANNNEPAPKLTLATSNAGATTVEGTVPNGTAAGTILDFYANNTSQAQARVYLGSFTVSTTAVGITMFSAVLTVPVSPGLYVTATATSPAGDTSVFSNTVQVASPFTVTNTNSSGVGSLSSAIAAADASPPAPGATDSIVFNIPTTDLGYDSTTMTFTIGVPAALPLITVPVTIDGTTESTFLGGATAIIQVDGNGVTGDGFVLATAPVPSSGSAGSTIDGLEITGFTGDAIQINTGSNTIGGTATGLGNTISGNSGIAIDVLAGSGNAIRQNLIYDNLGGAIVQTSTIQAAPSIIAAASVPNLTTIDYSLAANAAGAYTVEFFASSGLGSPAAQFLGTTTVTLTAGESPSLTASFDITVGLTNSQAITATVTGPNHSTSVFAAAVTPRTPTPLPSQPSAFDVTNNTDEMQGSFVGSLRLAIMDADNSSASPGTDTIGFSITTGPLVIDLKGALPLITVPVLIDGTSQSGFDPTEPSHPVIVQINANGVAGDGLTLAAGTASAPNGSGGSTIQGLDIVGFQTGTGINIQSDGDTVRENYVGIIPQANNAPGATSPLFVSDANQAAIFVAGNSNTIGGIGSADANTIGFNTSGGVAVLSGSQDFIRENIYIDKNGPLTPVQANDIGLNPNANNDQPAPSVISAVLSGTASSESLAISFTDSGPHVTIGTSVILDIYVITVDASTNPVARIFLGTATATVGSTPSSVTITTAGVDLGDEIIATATVQSNGTSVFSNEVPASSPNVVTNTSPYDVPGSLAYAINNGAAGSPITFDIPTTDAGYSPATDTYTITITGSSGALPAIMRPLTINGFTQSRIYAVAPTTVPSTLAPNIQIDGNGSNAPYGIDLAPGSNESTIEGLSIFNFTSGDGILVDSENNIIEDNWLGASPIRTVTGNEIGVLVDSQPNTIGKCDQCRDYYGRHRNPGFNNQLDDFRNHPGGECNRSQ